ncbi:MAG: hypothetical protein AB9834_01950 [Lentimicrobium sp.]
MKTHVTLSGVEAQLTLFCKPHVTLSGVEAQHAGQLANMPKEISNLFRKIIRIG